MFKNVLHDLKSPASIYKLTTIGHIKYRLGYTKTRPAPTREQLIASAAGIGGE